MKKILLLTTLLLMHSFDVFAVCANFVTYSDGQVLTAGSLNSLQTNYTNCVNAVLDGDTFTGDINMHSGSDILMFTDTGSTKTIHLDAATGEILGAPLMQGGVYNCGVEISGSTFTIEGGSGAALSATNPCYVVTESNTTGASKALKFVADIDVTFGAASNTDGNVMGISSSGSDWGNVMPMFVGTIYDGSNGYFTLSRIPISASGTIVTDVCQLDDTDCDGQGDVMILTTGLTLANWVDLPITQVGWMKGTWATATSAWTFTTPKGTGFNNNYEGEFFTFVSGQMGAVADRYCSRSTCPEFTTNNVGYAISKDMWVKLKFNLSGDGGADGSLGNVFQMAIPYIAIDDFSQDCGTSESTSTVLGTTPVPATVGGNTSFINFGDSSGAANLDDSDFTNGGRAIRADCEYKIEQ